MRNSGISHGILDVHFLLTKNFIKITMYFKTQIKFHYYINSIDTSAIIGAEKQQKLFNQSYKVQITPLLLYGLGVNMHTP